MGDNVNTGTIVLSSGANIYTGGTTVSGGAALSIGTDADLGDPTGGVTFLSAPDTISIGVR